MNSETLPSSLGSLRADPQPRGCFSGRGGFSLLLGESKLWVFQEMSDLPGFRVTDQLELRKGGREGRFPVSPAFVSHMSPRQTNHNHRLDQLWKHRTGNPEHLCSTSSEGCASLGVCVCVCLCASLFSFPLLFSGTWMQTGLETTGLVVTGEPDTRSPTLLVPRPSPDSDPGSDPIAQAALQHTVHV